MSVASHHHAVEHDGDRRAFDELPERVEHARHQRDERHAQQIGHRDARQQHGEVELLRRLAEARRQAVHQERHGDFGDDDDHQEDEHQAGQRLLGELARHLPPFALEALGEQRHEGGVEGAFAEQAAKQVGKAEGDEEGVGYGAAAEDGSDEDVAQKAEYAAQQGEAADSREGAVELHARRAVAEP